MFGPEVAASADSLLDEAVRQLLDYLAGQREEFDLTLAQQVGQAVGANPLCISMPCHRVVGSNGSLTGYAGGLKRKKAPLQLEGPAELSAGRLF
jgi:methylated-DNA-[protein]-cysteine S-methyltransferase